MNEQKIKTVKIQYIIAALLPLLALVLPFVRLSVSVAILGTVSWKLSGMKLISGIADINKLMDSELADLVGSVTNQLSEGSVLVIIGILLIFVVPLMLFVISAVMGVLSLKKREMPKNLAVLPLAALILSVVGLVVSNILIKFLIRDALGEAAGVVGDAVSIKVSGQTGFWIFVLAGAVLGIESLVLGRKERGDYSSDYVQEAIYREKTTGGRPGINGQKNVPKHPKERRPTTTWTNNDILQNSGATKGPEIRENDWQQNGWMAGAPTVVSKGMSGTLIGVRGEYEGAQIPLLSGQKIYIGRSNECNLILTNMKASRKHCRVSYDAGEDMYLITSYSGNGTYLTTGQRLEENRTYHLPHGTVFRVTKEDEFRLL